MAATVNVNGRISGDTEATVSVFDHGFLFGAGVYETLRTYHRRPFLFDRHVARLCRSAARLQLTVPFTQTALLERVDATVEASRLRDHQEAYIRILLTRGVGDLSYDPAACPEPTVVIIVKPHAPPPPEAFEPGARIVLSSVIRNHPESVDPIIKSNNLLNNALAMQEAITQGAYEALMRNYRGELAECSQSNFFIVRGGVALTPPIEAGLLEGITRSFLFEIGAEVGVPVRDAVLFEHDLDTADEAFLTSSTREIVPVVRVDDRLIGSGAPGPVTRTLLQTFRQKADVLTRPLARSVQPAQRD